MQDIGSLLKSSRQKKRLSVKKLSQITKIKPQFLTSIENQDWSKLPDFLVVVGFVDKIAKAVGIDPQKAKALLRRDYSLKSTNPNPKPDVSARFSWNPKNTFALGTVLVAIAIGAYLIYQVKAFNKPPIIDISNPQDDEIVLTTQVFVTGKTDEDATVFVNNQQLYVDEYGNFSGEIKVYENTKNIEVRAISRSGKETAIVRNIQVQLE